MASLNKVLLIGNLTREPELRYTPSGSAVCEFGLAINRQYVSNGQEQKETCFVDIVVWSKQAETCSRMLEKGAPVLVEGRLHFEQWQERETGAKRSRLRVVADRVQFLSRSPERAGGMDDGSIEPQEENTGYSRPQQPQQPRPNTGFQQQSYPQQNKYQKPQPPQQPGRAPQAPQSYPDQRNRQGGQGQPPPMPDGAFDVENTEDDIPF